MAATRQIILSLKITTFITLAKFISVTGNIDGNICSIPHLFEIFSIPHVSEIFSFPHLFEISPRFFYTSRDVYTSSKLLETLF